MNSDDSYEAPFETEAGSTPEIDTKEPQAAGEQPTVETDPEVEQARAAFEADQLAPATDQADEYVDADSEDDVESASPDDTVNAVDTDEVAVAAEPATETTDQIVSDADTVVETNDADEIHSATSELDDQLAELAQPFVGQWNNLISTTNWEKGKIISEWRTALIASEAPATDYSDEAWSQRVGGVTAPHVGRLRRVYDQFGSTQATYEGLYWSHFLAALDWEDAPLWLEGASNENWSVSGMRQQRWQAHGAVESQRPTSSQIVEVDTDEDVVVPAQGGSNTSDYDDQPGNVASGPVYEAPDFGDEEELTAMGSNGPDAAGGMTLDEEAEPPVASVQPFAGLPELPDDLSDVIEQLKLSVLRHKTAGWETVTVETIQKYLDAMGILIRA